jgi:DNA repair exonuclease SbcCD ATPase subunit
MMQQLLSQMIENENSKLMAKMQEILEKMQKMSKKEGELMEQSKELDKNSEDTEFKQNAKEQSKLSNELSNTIEDLMSLSEQMPMTPQMGKLLGDAFNEMNKATQSLNNKEGPSANKSQGKAKESLDKAIQKLQSMCESGNKPGMGNSLQQLLQALQQLIEKQQGINQQLGQISPEGKEGKFTQEQMAQMQRLALEQETVRKNLQQLNEEFKKQQEMEGKKLLGNLDEVQKDMMEIIKDLEQNSISPETRKRQEKILSRMLDFQLSVREKDFEKKRESRPGKNFDRTSPPEIIISMPKIVNGINQDALELQRESYSEDYEVLIQKYMEKIRLRSTQQ